MRIVALLSVLFAVATMPASASELDAKFLIKHEGKVIGYHQVRGTETALGLVVDTEVEMRVRFGPIPLYKYDHEAREVWRNGEVISIESKTNDNGTKTSVFAHRKGDTLLINGTLYSGPAPVDAVPPSYWDKSLINASSVINTQTGEILDVGVEHIGQSAAPDNQAAEQYRITGTINVDVWYDGSRWVGSHLFVDGEELIYELVEGERQFAALEEYLD